MEDKFACPKCNAEFERNAHYKAILQNQNFINLMMGNKKIADMCSKCNHFIEEK